MIALKDLIKYIDIEKSTLHHFENSKLEFGGVVNLVAPVQFELSDEIFFAVSEIFETPAFKDVALPGELPLIFCCLSDDQIALSSLYDWISGLQNYVIYTNRGEFDKAYFTLAKIFSIHARMHSLTTRLSQLVVQDKSLQEIADEIALACSAPVAINDNAFNLLAYSLVQTRQTELGEAEMANFSLDNRTISELHRKGIISNLFRSTLPIKFQILGETAYATAIRQHGMQIASMTVFESNNPIDPLVTEYFTDIANIISAALSDTSMPHIRKYNNIPYLLSYLLNHPDNAVLSFENMQNRFRLFEYNLYSNMNIVFIDGMRSSFPISTLHHFADTYHRIFSNSCFMLIDDGIMFLISRSSESLLTEKEFSRWHRQLSAAGIMAGMSSNFQDFSNFRLHLEEAKSACKAAADAACAAGIFKYDDFRLKDISRILNKAHPELYKYPPLIKLYEYDKKYGTELCRTLKLYLENPKEIDRICQTLFIHKNTLFYRMNKIRSIMGIDLYRGEEIALVMLSLELLKT